ncbi:hypothetical protein T492DRAFT_917760 [Pavlovales sp. CCMP2436]|nr:hypothetical protein T492DRAFT_917760 [Pavlovales sp. CCMP2436]
MRGCGLVELPVKLAVELPVELPVVELHAEPRIVRFVELRVAELAGHGMAGCGRKRACKSCALPACPSSGLAGLFAVDLGTAGNFVVLSKTGISTVPPSVITGDIGVSPIAGAAITGFGEKLDGTFATAGQVTGKIFAADYMDPTPTTMTTAISDMQTAYTDAAGRASSDANKNLFDGLIGGKTLAPGVYAWTTDVNIAADVTIEGSATDIFIFQTTGNVIVASGKQMILAGGALAQNIVWQVAGEVDAGTTSTLQGIFLVKTRAVFKTGATLIGRVLAQTAVTLDSTTVKA